VIERKQETAAGSYNFRNEHSRVTALVIAPFQRNATESEAPNANLQHPEKFQSRNSKRFPTTDY
jgi:hypothetical protein